MEKPASLTQSQRVAIAMFVSAALVVLGMRSLRTGYKLWAALPHYSAPPIFASFAFYALSFACIIIAIAGPPRLVLDRAEWLFEQFAGLRDALRERAWPRMIVDYGSLLAVILMIGKAMFRRYGVDYIGTDGLLFAQYAVDSLFEGHNPYAVSMHEAFERYAANPSFGTYRIDGTVVAELSYPAMSVLAFVPQRLMGVPHFDLTSLTFLLAASLLLVALSPTVLKPCPALLLASEPDLIRFTAGGVFDSLWMLPMLLAMLAFHRRRLVVAGLLLGVACSTKQTPWFVAPFLCLWLICEGRTLKDGVRNIVILGGSAVAAFLVTNAPFLLNNPAAWLRGVLVPVAGGAPLVEIGSGAIMLNIAGVTHQPKIFFSMLMAAAFILLAIAYCTWFSRLKWLAWCAPMIVLWFNYRSLQNYYVYLYPVAYLGVLLKYREAPPVDPPRRGLVFFTTLATVMVSFGVAMPALAERAALPAKMELLATQDADDLGRITHMRMRLTNEGAQAIRPTFGVVHSEHQTPVHWRIEDGPEELAGGATADYALAAGMQTATVPYDASLHVRVYDRGHDARASLFLARLYPPDALYPRVRNPRFHDWSVVERGNSQPFLWGAKIGKADTHFEDAQPGALISVSGSVPARAAPRLEPSGLEQSLNGPLDTLFIDVTPQTVADGGIDVAPSAGVEVRIKDYCVAIVFAKTASVQEIKRGETTCKVIGLAAVPNERLTTTVRFAELAGEQFVGRFNTKRASPMLYLYAAIPSDGRSASASAVFHDVHMIPERAPKPKTD